MKAAQQAHYWARRKTGGPRSSAAADGVLDEAADGVSKVDKILSANY